MSKDENLINMFKNNIDVYIATAKSYLQDRWDTLTKKEQKAFRKTFKTVTLALMYGQGVNALASRLNITKQDAQAIVDQVYTSYPKLREYIKEQQEYPLHHNGRVRTFFGDVLVAEEWKYYLKATDPYEKKALAARIGRAGSNYPIQGGTSLAMSSGFFNDLRVAKQEGWDLTSFITVHK